MSHESGDRAEDAKPGDVRAPLHLVAKDPLSGVQLARTVQNKVTEKHHRFLSEELLSADYASGALDLGSVEGIVGSIGSTP